VLCLRVSVTFWIYILCLVLFYQACYTLIMHYCYVTGGVWIRFQNSRSTGISMAAAFNQWSFWLSAYRCQANFLNSAKSLAYYYCLTVILLLKNKGTVQSLEITFLMCVVFIKTFWLDVRYLQATTVLKYGNNYKHWKILDLDQLFFFL